MRKAIVLLETFFFWKKIKKSGIRFWSNNRLNCDLFSKVIIFGPTGFMQAEEYLHLNKRQLSHDSSDAPSIG